MKQILLVFAFTCFLSLSGISLTTFNIKTNFGAVGDGVTDDHAAFTLAATTISSTPGDVLLIIPFGTYIVGNQVHTPGSPASLYAADPVFQLTGRSNVTISGIPNSGIYPTLKLKSGFKYGTFNTTTLLPPAGVNDYNPFGVTSCAEIFPGAIATYSYNVAPVSPFFTFDDCYNIILENLKIDGNITGCTLGGNYGCGDRPIELHSWGIKIIDSENILIENVSLDDIAQDGIWIVNNGAAIKTDQITINQVTINRAGRNGISWTGGDNLTITSSSVSNTGQGPVKSKPSAGFDIEPENSSYCSNGLFEDNSFEGNLGAGVVTGSYDSYNMIFKRCIMQSGNYYSVLWSSDRTVFDDCKFFGEVLHYANASSTPNAVVYNDCQFADCRMGTQMWGTHLLTLSGGRRTEFDSCKFLAYYNPLFFLEPTITSCSTEAEKPIVTNSTFITNVATSKQYGNWMGVAFNIRWENNTFSYITGYPPYISPGCGPGQDGNTDLGSGLVYYTLGSIQDCSNLNRAANGYVKVDEQLKNATKPTIVFPNPVRDIIYLNLPTVRSSKIVIQIYTQLGQLIMTKELPTYQKTVSIAHLRKGAYQVRIFSKEKIYNQIILKE